MILEALHCGAFFWGVEMGLFLKYADQYLLYN
jgi:hypothetical protein